MKALSLLVLLLLVLLSSGYPARAAIPANQAKNLFVALKSQCELPVRMTPYTKSNFDRYLLQLFDPELKMLSTAFLEGFALMDSNNLRRGYCVITFLGLPNDPNWEASFDYYGKAAHYGVLPRQMFAGFDATGQVLLKPMKDVN